MSRRVSVSELETHCLRIVQEVATRRLEVVITKRGKRIARLVPIDEQNADEALDRLRGTLLRGCHLPDFETGVTCQAARR